MICLVLAALGLFPHHLDEWHFILMEFMVEIAAAVLVYSAWIAGVR